MIKDYYHILGVGRNASELEIKKSYRRLALKYHPDKNTDPAAKQIIQEVNEAYDVLGDLKKRERYNQRLDNRHVTPPTYRKKPGAQTPTGPSRQKGRPFKKNSVDYTEYARTGRLLSTFVLFYCALLCLDFCISQTYRKTVVEHLDVVAHTSRRSATYYSCTVASDQVNFSFSTEHINIHEGEMMDIVITPVFGIVTKISTSDGKTTGNEVISIYRPFWFLIILSMAASIACLRTKSKERSFTISIFSVMMFLWMFYITYVL